MAEQEEQQEPEAEAAQVKPRRLAVIAGYGRSAAKSVGSFLAKLGLLLFMLALPLMLVSYPAYRISARLVEYSLASSVEAQLNAIDIRTVEVGQDQATLFEARKHFDVVFEFKGDKGQKYASVAEMSWPAPGLKRKLENQYQVGDTYTLYLLPDKAVELDEMVARDSFYRLTGLMGLVFVASALFFMLWKRLARRMPAVLPRFPAATAKSIMLGQLITLVVAGLLTVVASFNPLVISPWLFVGLYWALVAIIALSLRLLVFEDPAPPPAPELEEEPPRRTR